MTKRTCRSISERVGTTRCPPSPDRRSCVARVPFCDRSGVAPMSLLCSSRVVSAPETEISFVAGSFDSGTRGNGWEASRPARCVPAPPCTRSNIVPMSFRCHSGVVSYQEARPIFLRWNDPRTKISFVANSFHFRTRGNDTRSSFEGTTGTQSERPTEFGGGGPNG